LVSLFPFGAHRLVCKTCEELRESPEQRFDSAYVFNTAGPQKVTYFDYSPTTEKVNRTLSCRDQPHNFLTYSVRHIFRFER
jgi:hypothetical protein